jgi:hypothetical protein
MANAHPTVEYREIPGYPGYRVGSDGSVWNSWVHGHRTKYRSDTWNLMKQCVNKKGYCYLNLVPPEGGSYKTFRVHRLVLLAFVGPCPEGMECRHLNGVHTDNRLENLCWGTPEENRQDNRQHGVYKKGESHHWNKTTEEVVREIRRRYAAGGVFMRQLAEEFNLTTANVHAIISRRSWKHID